jgi:hypothetical protein
MMVLLARYDRTLLLEHIQSAYGFLDRTLALIPEARRDEPGVVGHWSVKDVVAHLMVWELRTLRWLDEARAGQRLTVPEPGFGWNEFDRLNDVYYQRYAQYSCDAILREAVRVRGEVLAVVRGFSEEELAGGGAMHGLFLDAPAIAIADNIPNHYAEHLEQMRLWLISKPAG